MRKKIRQFFESVVDAMDDSVEKRHAWIVEAADKQIKAEQEKEEEHMSYELTIMGSDGIRRNYDENFVTAKDVEEDPVGAHYAIQEQHIYIYQLTESLQDMVAAFAGGGVTESGSDRVLAVNNACAILNKVELSGYIE